MVWDMVSGGPANVDALISSGAWQVITLIILALFLFVTKIVLLNMIIALMRDMYNKVGVG